MLSMTLKLEVDGIWVGSNWVSICISSSISPSALELCAGFYPCFICLKDLNFGAV
jgi:hypothetical protein